MSNFNENNIQKFYCHVCGKVTLGQLVDIQTHKGIHQSIICNDCGNVVSLFLLDSINRLLDEAAKSKNSIDQRTKFVVGSPEYNDYHYPKIDESEKHR